MPTTEETSLPGLTPRLVVRVRRDFGRDADDVFAMLGDLRPVLAGTGIDPERVLAAVVLAARGTAAPLRDALALAHVDVRDLLVAGGLASADWPAVLDRELGAARPATWSPTEGTPPPPSTRSGRRSGWRGLLLLALVVGLALGWLAWRDARADDLLRTGDRVPGVVTEVDYGTTRSPASFSVRYEAGGRAREETVHGQRPSGKYLVGDRVTVVVDPDDPDRIRTVDEPNTRTRFATLVLVVGTVSATGLVVLGAMAGLTAVRGRRRRPGRRGPDPRDTWVMPPRRTDDSGRFSALRRRVRAYYHGSLGLHFLLAAFSMLVVVLGALWLEEQRSETLLREGERVPGVVTAFERDEQRRAVAVTVRYTVDGRERTGRVVVENGHGYDEGQRVTVVADPRDPTRIRTVREVNTRLEAWPVVPAVLLLWLALVGATEAWRRRRTR